MKKSISKNKVKIGIGIAFCLAFLVVAFSVLYRHGWETADTMYERQNEEKNLNEAYQGSGSNS